MNQLKKNQQKHRIASSEASTNKAHTVIAYFSEGMVHQLVRSSRPGCKWM
jgi:hypothetical protein